MVHSPRLSLTAVLTALAVMLTGGPSAAAVHCPPSHHGGATVACCPAQSKAVKSSCLYTGQCLFADHEAVWPNPQRIDPPQPGGTAKLSSEHDPAARALDPLLSQLLSLEEASAPPRGSSVPLHLLNAVFLN